MSDPIVLVAIITQIGTLVGVFVTARSARGAKTAATGAKRAAITAKDVGQADHADHTEALAEVVDVVKEIRRDVGGLRSDDREMRRELHDLRQKINRHIGLGD